MGLFDSFFPGMGAQVAPNGTGILGGMPYANGGGPGASFNQGQPAGGGFMNNLTQWFQNNPQAISGLASGLMTPTYPGQRGMAFAQGLQGYQQGKQADLKTNENKALGSFVKGQTALTPQMQQLLAASPDLAKAYLSQQFIPKQPTWGEIGTNQDGTKQYGWIDPFNQKVTPGPQGQGGGGMFNASSVDGQALNWLIRNNKIDQTTAANMAAGKPITDPSTGAVSFMTPSALMQQMQQGQGQAAPQGGAPGGVVPLTAGKPGGNLTEKQQQAKMLAKVIDPEVAVVDKNFGELGKMGNQAAGAIPIAGNFMVTPGYQQAKNSLSTIISSYLYVTSGATASPKEIENQASILTPKPGDDPTTIANKLARIHTMADAVRQSAGGGASPQAPQGATPQMQPGQIVPHPTMPGVTIERLN